MATPSGGVASVDVRYTEQLRLAPTLTYPWTVAIGAEGLAVTPRTMSDVLQGAVP